MEMIEGITTSAFQMDRQQGENHGKWGLNLYKNWNIHSSVISGRSDITVESAHWQSSMVGSIGRQAKLFHTSTP